VGRETPAIKWSRYQDRRQTAADIAELFRDDDSNIAILTGVISGVVVIDADSPQAMAWCARRLPWSPLADADRERLSRVLRASRRCAGVESRADRNAGRTTDARLSRRWRREGSLSSTSARTR
jgi:hypothetical protein